jgi:hypothetical protein
MKPLNSNLLSPLLTKHVTEEARSRIIKYIILFDKS